MKLEIQHLAVTAVEQATILSEMEGATAADAAAENVPAFRVLKTLVHKWLQDATSFQNRLTLTSSLLLLAYEIGLVLIWLHSLLH